MDRFGQSVPCNNLNHRRKDAPVRHCPECGGVVNQRRLTEQCSDTRHATARRERTAFCIACGTQLIFDR